jgi:hypothetical protein
MAMITPAVFRAGPAIHLVSLALATAGAAGGCLVPGAGRQPMTAEPAVGRSEPAGRLPPANQTIPLELLFVRYAEHDDQLGEELWQFVDEQVLPSDLRGRLAANGLRAGIIGGHLPAHLAARFAGGAEPEAGEQLPTDARLSRRLIRLLPGRRGEIVTASGVRELVLLEQAAGEVRGGTYRDASPLLAIEAKPAADGRIEVEVTPEIRHGPLEKSWVGEDGMFRLETGQQRHRLEHLQFTVTLPSESMLVVGCGGEDTATTGDCLFRDHDRGDRTSLRLVAVRPLTKAVDPLFAPQGDDVDDQAAGEPLVIR